MSDFIIRNATLNDAEAVLAIYAPFISDSCISFEYEVPTLGQFRERMRNVMENYPWLVAEAGGKVVGYAYGNRFRERAAYYATAESSVYVAPDFHGKQLNGTTVAAALYEKLFQELKTLGIREVIGGLTHPNPKSERFHEKMGFERIGVFPRIGYKFDQWHGVLFMQKSLG